MEAEAIEAAKAAAELNIMGGLASVTGVQSPAPTRTAGATAQNNDAAMGAASPLRLVFTFNQFPTNQCIDNICFSIHNN